MDVPKNKGTEIFLTWARKYLSITLKATSLEIIHLALTQNISKN